jgi:hypothetical protein
MNDPEEVFEATQPTSFFDDLGSGIRLSKKQTLVRSEILEGSHQNIQQNSLQDKIDKYRRQSSKGKVSRDNAVPSLPVVPAINEHADTKK